MVGFALVNYAGWTPEFSCVLPHRYACLADLVVDEAHRQQGIGSTLLGAAKRWAQDRRLEYLELSVLSQNAPRHRPVRIPRLRRGDTGYAVYAVKQ